MRLFKNLGLSYLLFFTASVFSAPVVVSHDFMLRDDNVKVIFSNDIFEEVASVSYRVCATCKWHTYPTAEITKFYNKRKRVSYPEFKAAQANGLLPKKHILIGVNFRDNIVFKLKWNYEED